MDNKERKCAMMMAIAIIGLGLVIGAGSVELSNYLYNHEEWVKETKQHKICQLETELAALKESL